MRGLYCTLQNLTLAKTLLRTGKNFFCKKNSFSIFNSVKSRVTFFVSLVHCTLSLSTYTCKALFGMIMPPYVYAKALVLEYLGPPLE